jgi:hypothetical protein
MKCTVTPTSVIAAIESRFTPRSGTYKTVSIKAVRFAPFTNAVNLMMPSMLSLSLEVFSLK